MSSLGAPTDPAYTAFLDGLKKVVALPVGKSLDRWHPKDAHWYTYDPKVYGQEDIGAPNTSPDGALSQEFSGMSEYSWKLNELEVPALFARLKKDYETLRSRNPRADLVWWPLDGGEWRSAFKHPPQSGGTGKELPPAAISLINEVRESERTGDFTHEEAEARIKKIKAQYGQG
jgi:hypothetical protein